MILLLVVLVLLCLCLALLWFFNNAFSYWKNEGLEHFPPCIPFGNVKDMYIGKKGFGETFWHLFRDIKRMGWRHAGIYFYWNGLYMPTDPVIIKDILIGSFDSFKNRGFYIIKEDPLTQHLFNLEDTKWKNVRAQLSYLFTTGKMKCMLNTMLHQTNILSEVIEEELAKGGPISVKSLFARYTTDVVMSCTMGIEMNSLRNKNAEILKHGHYFFFRTWSKLNNTIVLTIPRQILRSLGFKITHPTSEKFFKDMFNGIKDYREKSNDNRNDLFDLMNKLTDENYTKHQYDFSGKDHMDPLTFDETVAQVFSFYQAGFETSSSTISFGLMELATHPECQRRLRNEIQTVMARHQHKLTYECLQEMEYLEMVMKGWLLI